MSEKNLSRLRRAKRTRMRIKEQEVVRLTIHRTPVTCTRKSLALMVRWFLASASTLDKTLNKKLKTTGNVEAAKEVGKLIAERAKKAGVEKIAFDRSGFNYHGRVKALADAAREGGLDF